MVRLRFLRLSPCLSIMCARRWRFLSSLRFSLLDFRDLNYVCAEKSNRKMCWRKAAMFPRFPLIPTILSSSSSRIKNYYLNAEHTKIYCCARTHAQNIFFPFSPLRSVILAKGRKKAEKSFFEMFVYNHFLRQMWE